MTTNEEEYEFENEVIITFDTKRYDKKMTPSYQLINQEIAVISPKERKMRNVLSNFEKIRIISERTEQLSRGAKPLIDVSKYHIIKDNFYNMYIAEIELKEKKIRNIIRRENFDGTYEDWLVSELAQL